MANQPWWRVLLDFIISLLGYKPSTPTTINDPGSIQSSQQEQQNVQNQHDQINNSSTGVNVTPGGGLNFDEFNKSKEERKK